MKWRNHLPCCSHLSVNSTVKYIWSIMKCFCFLWFPSGTYLQANMKLISGCVHFFVFFSIKKLRLKCKSHLLSMTMFIVMYSLMMIPHGLSYVTAFRIFPHSFTLVFSPHCTLLQLRLHVRIEASHHVYQITPESNIDQIVQWLCLFDLLSNW